MFRRFPVVLLVFFLLAGPVSAFAAPGELMAVEQHCGPPGAERKETSQVTGQLERTLIYNNTLYLHFEPVAGGWSFTTAWNGHLPMSRNALEKRLPCFRDAIIEAANGAPETLNIDPSIAQQTIHAPANNYTFGIPHFALIVLLIVTLIIFLLLPSARQRRLRAQQEKPVEHIYRKPNLDDYPAYVPPSQRMSRVERVEVVDRETGEVVETEKAPVPRCLGKFCAAKIRHANLLVWHPRHVFRYRRSC